MRHLLPALCFFVAYFGLHPAHAQFTVSGPETICTGSSATLNAANCGGTLRWSTGETTASITVSPAITTTYYVTCTVGNAKTTGSLSPVVAPGLQLNSNVGSCFTDQATLSVPGVPIGSNLRWERDGVLIPGAGSNNYTATQPGVYTVKSDIPTAAWTWQNLLPDGENFNDIYFATDLLGVAVGDYGKIVRTTDGGQTWSRIESFSAGKYNLQSVHFVSSSLGWISGWDNTLLKTTDGGVTWNRGYIASNYKTLSTIYFADVDHGWILDNFTSSVLKTTDGGISWAPSYTLPAYLGDIFFADSQTGWLVVGKEVKKTTDGGSTWTTVLTAGEYGSFYKVFFLNASEGWAVGRRGLHKTTDGGSTWTDYSGAVPFGLEFRDVYFSDGNHGTVVSSEGIFRTTNGGSSWNLTDAPPIDPLSVFMRSADKAWVAGRGGRVLTGQQSVSSYDWKVTLGFGVNSGASVVSQRAALDFVNKNVGWAGNGNDFLLKTNNGGKVWTPTSLKDVYDVDFVDESTGYAVARGMPPFPSSIYKSTDGGNTWTAKYNFATGSSPRIQFVNSNVGWVINASNDIFRTTNGGNTWTAASTGMFLQDLFFVDALHGWVSGVNGQAARTTDGGITWTAMNVGTNFIQALYFKNQNEGWSLGLTTRKTTDGGLTWTANLSDGVSLKFRSMDFSDPDFGVALGYNPESNGGLPAYKTLNGGSSWIKQSIPTRTQFTEMRLADSSSAWISDGRGAIMHYAAPVATCAASITLRRSVPGPNVTASTQNALCEGESITLTASGCPDALSWSDGSTGSTITVTPYASTSYTAFCDAGNGCKGAAYTGVAVIPKIRLDTSTSVPCIRPNFTASNFWFGVDLIWKKDGNVIPGQWFKDYTATSPGTYTAQPDVAGAWASQTGTFTNASLTDITFASPSVGFAVGGGGTILKTTDGGTSWKTLPGGTTDNLRQIQAVSSQTAFILGDRSIVRTTDGGNTWKSLGLGGIGYIYDMSFANENVGWAITNYQIYKTTDGGAHWATQYFNGFQGYVKIQAVDANTVFVLSANKISKTTDGGNIWTTSDLPANNFFNDLHFIDATHGWVVGGSSAILYTSDAGVSWAAQIPPPSLPSQGLWNFYQVQFLDNLNGWIKGSGDFIFTTSDGGQTWKVSTSLNKFTNTERFYLKTPTEGFVVGRFGVLARTQDSTATWQEVGETLKSGLLQKVQFVNNSTGFVVGEEGLLLKTTNGGKSWLSRVIPHEGSWLVYDMFFSDIDHGWILASGKLYTTSDGGLSWAVQLNSDMVLGLLKLYFVNATTGWGVGAFGNISKTTDGGVTWTRQTSNTSADLASVFFLDASRGWTVGNSGTYLATTDGGTTWTSQDTGFPYGSFRFVQFTSPTKGWVVNVNQLLNTTDGGVSWQRVYVDKSYVYAIPKFRFVSDSVGFVLGDKFVYATRDAGATWQKTYAYENYTDMSFTDAAHGWVIGFKEAILSYHLATAPCQSEPIVVAPQSIEPISTRLSGDWNTPYVWSCGLVPTVLDDVRINAEHVVTLPGGYAAEAKSVDLRGQIQYNANASLRMGQD